MKSPIEQNMLGNQTVATVQRQTFTIAEAAKILGISRTVAYRRGVLPTIKVGGKRLVPKPALERMLAGDIVIADGNGPTKTPEKFSPNEPKRAQTADRRGAQRATFSPGPSSRNSRRMHNGTGRTSQ